MKRLLLTAAYSTADVPLDSQDVLAFNKAQRLQEERTRCLQDILTCKTTLGEIIRHLHFQVDALCGDSEDALAHGSGTSGLFGSSR